MLDFEFERFIMEGIERINQVVNCCQPGELYTLTDILAMLGIRDAESRDFFHVVLHCHSAIDTVYQVECKHCKHVSLARSLRYAANSVCPFCHNKDLEITELFRLKTSVAQVFGEHKCSFCGKKIKAGFIGRDNKIICWDCVRKFKELLMHKEGGESEKEKRS